MRDWDAGLGRATRGSGTRGSETRRRGTRGLGEVRLRNVEIGEVGSEKRRLGDARRLDRGRDKQTTPDIFAEFVEYNFLRFCGSFLILF